MRADLHSEPAIVADESPAAVHCELARLTYVDDRGPGITRRLVRGKFQYVDANGKPIAEPALVARLNALAIPPAYRDVWICPDPNGHIQATARDARGRKQYRYHPHWHAVRDANKYGQLVAFGLALPRIRRCVERDMKLGALCHDKVVAVVVKLLETTLIRIGSAAYAIQNQSYGLTTLRRRHATVAGDRIRFRFKGKSGVEHDVTVNDRRIARVIRRCMEISGQTLFHYMENDDTPRAVDSGCVNAYLKATASADFTAKHYRTWAASVYAMAALQKRPWVDQKTARQTVVQVVREVAQRLGNTPAICRACYIHPLVIERYLEGRLPPREPVAAPRGLNADERRLLAFLSAQAGGDAPSSGAS